MSCSQSQILKQGWLYREYLAPPSFRGKGVRSIYRGVYRGLLQGLLRG